MANSYSDLFYDYIESGSRQSARRILPLVQAGLKPASVLDVGCGRGVWLAEWLACGVRDVFGSDGPYVDPQKLTIPADCFRPLDLSAPFDLGRRFSLVQCLEVAEHIPAERATTLIANLTRHADIVMFSAAVPGQGGKYHVNERPLSYWRDLFAQAGFAAFDWLRPQLAGLDGIEPWYRYNVLFYVNNDVAGSLPGSFQETAIPSRLRIPHRQPWTWRLRCSLLRLLPPGLVTLLAEAKHRAVVRRLARSQGI